MPAKQSIDNAVALYRKLERTFDRRAIYEEHQLDWVFDFAVTAWHMVDWVARETPPGGKGNVKATQERLKKKFAELAICEQVANGAKHLVLDHPQLKTFNVTKNVLSTDGLVGISRDVVPGDQPVDVILTPSVCITENDGKSWEAATLFHRVLLFWKRELNL